MILKDHFFDEKNFATSVLNSQSARIAVINAEGFIIAVNDAWREFARANGASDSTVEGSDLNYLKVIETTDQNDLYAFSALDGIKNVLRGKSELFKMEYSFDMPEEILWFEMYVTPLKLESGGAVIAHYSIDERKKIEKLVEYQKTHLNAIFNSAREGFITLTFEQGITSINNSAAQILGIDKEKLLNKKLYSIKESGFVALLHLASKALNNKKSVHDKRVEYISDANIHKILLVDCRILDEENIGREEVLIVFRDVTRLYTLEQQLDQRKSLGNIVGSSKAMQSLFDTINRVAVAPSTALILGESGTGKSLVASQIHQNSKRRNGPFVTFNCASISDNILQSELFGHVKGAFTGAVSNRIGRFEAADGGTLFLDEIGDITPNMQASLLRVLEEGKFERVGDSKTMKVDVRVIAATNRDLVKAVNENNFREDLYYRLNVAVLNIPPLRQRKDDIPLLAEHFRNLYNREMAGSISTFDSETIRVLTQYDWPGNIRELRNAIEKAFILCTGDTLLPSHFQLDKNPQLKQQPAATQQVKETSYKKVSIIKEDLEVALLDSNWNISRTARKLGFTRQYIHMLIKRYGISKNQN